MLFPYRQSEYKELVHMADDLMLTWGIRMAQNEMAPFGYGCRGRASKNLQDLFNDYGIRPSTLAVIAQMGFTASTLVNMTEREIDCLIETMMENYHLDMLVGEKFGIKSALRAERRILEEVEQQSLATSSKIEKKEKNDQVSGVNGSVIQGMPNKERKKRLQALPENVSPASFHILKCDEFTLLEESQPSYGFQALTAPLEVSGDSEDKTSEKTKQKRRRLKESSEHHNERPREHPFVVTESGEVASGKKNGLDYLFDLYEQAGKYLEEVQHLARERGEKCPTKVRASLMSLK
eukprot:c25961_g1_i5 orf=768-1646(-)